MAAASQDDSVLTHAAAVFTQTEWEESLVSHEWFYKELPSLNEWPANSNTALALSKGPARACEDCCQMPG